MLVYVFGPYRGDVDQNIKEARVIAIKVWEAGHVAICPHLNTANFEQDCSCTDQQYLDGTMAMLARCDAAIGHWNWEQSEGSKAEYAYCKEHGIPVGILMKRDNPLIIEDWEISALISCPHPVEQNCPAQAEGFISTIMQMYRLHLSKNMDYSPANILGTGEVGIIVRLWDKMARLMNLMGFNLKVEPGAYSHPRQANHESIDDTLLDAANYAIIARLFRQGKWGN